MTRREHIEQAILWHAEQKKTAQAENAELASGTRHRQRSGDEPWQDITAEIQANNEQIIKQSEKFIAAYERMLTDEDL